VEGGARNILNFEICLHRYNLADSVGRRVGFFSGQLTFAEFCTCPVPCSPCYKQQCVLCERQWVHL